MPAFRYKKELQSVLVRAEYALNNIHFEQGLRLAKSALQTARKNNCIESEAEALLLVSEYHKRVSEYSKALSRLDMAYEAFSAIRSKRSIKALHDKGLIFIEQREFSKAFAIFDHVLNLSGESGYPTGIALGRINLAFTEIRSERNLDEAYRHLCEVSPLVDSLQQPSISARFYNIFGTYYYYHHSNFATALEYWQKADILYREEKNSYELQNVLHNRGTALRNIGEMSKAIECLEEKLKLAKEMGHTASEGVAAMSLAAFRIREGNFKEALTLCFHALSRYEKISSQVNIGYALANIALIYEQLGLFDMAIRYYQEAQKLYTKFNVKRGLVVNLVNLAELLANCSEYENARVLATEGLALAEQLGNTDEIIHGHAVFGVIYGKNGRRDLAYHHYYRALELTREVGLVHQSAHILVQLGHCEIEEARYSSAEAYFLEAADILKNVVSRVASIKATQGLARLYHHTGRYDQSEALYQQALAESLEIGNKSLSCDLYKGLSELYKSRHSIEKAFENFEHYYQLQKELLSNETRKMLSNITLAFEVEPLQHQMSEMRNRTKLLELELERKNRELTALSMKLSRKDELLETIKEQIETTLVPDPHSKPAAQTLLRTIRSNYSHEKNWEVFEEQFRHIHPEFITRLLDRHPGLTPTEIRICCYLRISLCSKQIAEMLNVTPNNINIHRTRIRKKCKLGKETNLSSYLTAL